MKLSERSGFAFFTVFAAIACSTWKVYDYQYNNLPKPLTAEQAGKGGFSEAEAFKHAKALTGLGPHPVGSDTLSLALQYVLKTSKEIKKNASSEVDVEVEVFDAKPGVNKMTKGTSGVYSDLHHVILRISPKGLSSRSAGNDNEEHSILVSAHVDTVFASEGAGDDSSNVAVMLELARGISQSAQGIKNGVIFLFNTGEEEGLNGAHSFITQHPWSTNIKLAIDLEAMGIGGKSGIFETAGSDPWPVETFAKAAKYPSGQVAAQDIFSSGVIKSSTDFQVYKEIGGLSGLDFAFTDHGAVYHTKNDKFKLLKPGSFQHLGENMLPFLLQVSSSSDLPEVTTRSVEEAKITDQSNNAIYFDILGSYMVVFQQSTASFLYNSVTVLSLLIWAASLFTGGFSAAVSFALSFLSAVLMLVLGVGLAVVVAFVLPLVSSSPTPYVASPWLVFGLFAAPALIGAVAGQHLGFLFLQKYLSKVHDSTLIVKQTHGYPVDLEAEKWLYKAGSIPWLVLLFLGNYFKIGSSYLALAWLVAPTIAYGLFEATPKLARSPSTSSPLKLTTLVAGMAVPILLSAGVLIHLPITIIGTLVRSDEAPGAAAEWLGNVIVAVFVATIVCLTLVYLLSYVHLLGAVRSIVRLATLMLALSLGVVSFGIVPPFTEDAPRAINVVQVVDTTGKNPTSYVGMFSATPGELTKEAKEINEGFKCGGDKVVDFVTLSVKYGCWANSDNELGWTKPDLPLLQLQQDTYGEKRTTHLQLDTKSSTRWALAINFEEIEDFSLKDAKNSKELVGLGKKIAVDGWHILQFSGGKNATKKFDLTLVWRKNSYSTDFRVGKSEDRPLIKIRTDMDISTPKVERIISKLPQWCTLYGESAYPLTLTFLSSVPVSFNSNITHTYE